MLRAMHAKKKYLLLLSAILILGVLGWYKYPVVLSNYETRQIDLNLLYFDATDKGTTTYCRIPQNEIQAQALFNLIKNVRFYKKIIQPSVAKSYSGHTGQIQIFLYTTCDDEKEVFALSANNDGTIQLKTGTSQGFLEYGVGYPGKQQERELYEKLYKFYQDTLTNDNWKSPKG